MSTEFYENTEGKLNSAGEAGRAGRAFKDRYFKDIRLLTAWETVEAVEAGKHTAPLENILSSPEADTQPAGGEDSRRVWKFC